MHLFREWKLQPYLVKSSKLMYVHNACNIMCNVPLSHLRSKGKASAYILYCTGSGMLTRYTHCGQCNLKILHRPQCIYLVTAFLKVPKKSSDFFDATLDCMFVYINISLNSIVGFYYFWGDKIEPMLNEQQQQDIHILAILGTYKHCFKVRCNASSYTRVFSSVLIKDHTHFSKNTRYLLQKEG